MSFVACQMMLCKCITMYQHQLVIQGSMWDNNCPHDSSWYRRTLASSHWLDYHKRASAWVMKIFSSQYVVNNFDYFIRLLCHHVHLVSVEVPSWPEDRVTWWVVATFLLKPDDDVMMAWHNEFKPNKPHFPLTPPLGPRQVITAHLPRQQLLRYKG